MFYEPFVEKFPELGWKETRNVTVFAGNEFGLPPDQYNLLELYCNEKNCDCRRVFFNVFSQKDNELIAVVTYGWETEKFYRKWLGGEDDPMMRKMAKEMVGLSLNVGSPQSKYANAALELVRSVLQDQNYVERIKRHYKMFKEVVNGKPLITSINPTLPAITEESGLDAPAKKKSRKRHRRTGH